MSKVKKHIQWGLTLLLAAVFALNCGRSNNQTQFTKNLEADANRPAPTYEEWVALVGQEKTDLLFTNVGQDSLNTLSYGLGISNLTALINFVTDGAKLTAMIGNDFIPGVALQVGPGGMTGLGAIVTVRLLKEVDNQMYVARSSNLLACSGLAPTGPLASGCVDSDTIMNLVNIINGLSRTEINQKLVALFGPAGFNVQRSLGGANDLVYLGRMAKVVAHVDVSTSDCLGKLCPLLTGLSAANIIAKLAPLMSYNPGGGVAWANKLVETIESTGTIGNLITVINGVSAANITTKMAPIIDTVSDCTKMGYTINNVTTLGTLINLIENVSQPTRMGQLINKIEDQTTYNNIQTTLTSAAPPTDWHGGAQSWGNTTKMAPHNVLGTGGAISITISGGQAQLNGFSGITPGSGYHPDLTYSNVFAGCGQQPVLHLSVKGGRIDTVATNHKVAFQGSGCTNGTFALTLVDSAASTGMARLVRMINYLTPANYFEMLSLIDTISNMDKLVVLVQDGIVIDDLVQMLNGMTPATTGAGCTGVVTIGGANTTPATATAFISGGAAAYVTVTNGGTGYSAATATATLGGCGAVATTVVVNAGVITGIYINTLPVNSMAEMVENITLPNVPRLVEVVNGQRIWDNIGTQTSAVGGPPATAPTASTYLGKMVTLISGLLQTQEGPIKVTQMINGVSNTDKIIDLIYGVSNTGNLSSIINGIFSASLGLGCSDSATSAWDTPTDGSACNTQGGGVAAGNGYVYGMRNQSVNTMVYVLENVANIQNLIGLINGTLPAQVSGLINHVASSGNGATTYNGLNSTQIEDPNSGTCGSCSGAAAATSTYSGAGMRLTKVIDFSAAASYPYDLAFLVNKTSVIKVAKLIIQMPIGQTATGAMGPITSGTGKIADLMTQINSTPAATAGISSAGNCFYTGAWPPPGITQQVISANITAAGSGYTTAPTVSFACDATVTAVATINAAGNINGIYITNPGTAGGCAASAPATITPALGGATATANIGSCASSRGLAQTTAAGTGPLTNIGKGKLVNVVNYISASSDTVAMTQMRDLVDGVTEAAKLGDLINRVQRSSNVLALLNAVTDTNNNTSTSQMVSLINAIPRAQMHKLTSLIGQLNNAIETSTDVLPQMDQDLVAQLMATYAAVSNTSAVTFVGGGSPNVTWNGHPLTVGREVVFTNAGGALPAGIASGQLYYVTSIAANTFTVSATAGGTNINFAAAGTGTHTVMADQPTAVSGVGPTMLASLIGQLPSTGGSGYGAAPTISGLGSFGGTGGAATATVVSGQATRINITAPGDCTVLPTITITGGGCTTAPTVAADWRPVVDKESGTPSGANTNQTLVALYLTSGGVGCTSAPTVNFAGGTCATRVGPVAPPKFLPISPPAATVQFNGVSSVDVTNPGSGYTVNGTATFTAGTVTATGTAIVAGGLNVASVTNLGAGSGTGYVAGNNCPITGAGGSGAMCNNITINGSNGITGCGTVTAGSDYMSNQVVTIGGNARAYAVVSPLGAVATGAGQLVVYNTGCGYTAGAVNVTVQGCTVNPTVIPAGVTVNASGQVTAISVNAAGSGCPRNPRVIITGTHSDGGTAIVGSVIGNNGVGSGYLAAISLSTPGDNLANLMTNLEKAPLPAAVNYNSTAPSISAREGMVRLLHHGVYYSTGPVPSLFPGVGPGYLANTLMATLNSGNSTMTVIGMMASDTASFADITVLVGCGDGVPYAVSSTVATATVNDWETFCRANGVW